MICNQTQFSIITVVYNDVGGLALTKSSIFTQNFPNIDIEWIVIDGGSSDGTVTFLEQCDLINLRWASEKDKGIYDAMNKGINMSKGEYLLFLNAGDAFPNSNTLASVNDALLSEAKPGVLFGGADYVFPDGESKFRLPKVASKSIWHGLPANHQATYYSRSVLNGLLYDLSYKICGDYYLIAKLYSKGVKAVYLKKSLVKFSVGGASYVNLARLFWEPYVIQRDVLGLPLFWRIVSFLKRGISTLGMIVLKNIHRAKRPTQHGA